MPGKKRGRPSNVKAKRVPAAAQDGPGVQPPDNPARPPGVEIATGVAELLPLDPKVIVWPEVRITSQYRDEESGALARSIQDVGQQTPVTVYLVDGQYIGADGRNRCQLAIERGDTSIMCVVRRGSGQDVLKSNIATALLRGHTNPLTVVQTLQSAYHDQGVDIGELALASGRRVEWVEQMLAIAQTSPAVKQALGEELIALGHAEVLSRIDNVEEQEVALRQVLAKRLTVKELEEYLAGGDETEAETDPDQEEEVSDTRGQETPYVCGVCGRDLTRAHIQSLSVCDQCMADRSYLSTHPLMTEILQVLAEAEQTLAQSPATVALAKRITGLVERVNHAEKKES